MKVDSKFSREYVGVHYNIPLTLLDATNYAKEEWDNITAETIINVFIKVGLTTILDSSVTETFDNNKLVKLFN